MTEVHLVYRVGPPSVVLAIFARAEDAALFAKGKDFETMTVERSVIHDVGPVLDRAYIR